MRLLGHTGKPPQYFRAWVYRIARNLAYDHFRSAGYRRETNADEITQTAPTNPEQQVMQQDNQQVIADALQQLTPDHREVVLLRFYDAMRLSEIAAVVGVPEGTVKSRLYHALKRLKGLLAKDFSALEEAR